MKKIGLVLIQPPDYSETFFNSKIKGLQEDGNEIILFTGPSRRSFKLCAHRKSPAINRFFLIQVFKMGIVGVTLLPYIINVKKFITLERQNGSTLKRALEKVYLNSQLLKFKGDWLHFGFATLTIDRELVAKAIGAKMAVSFRGYDINVYPLKHPGCYDLLWKQVDKVHAISQYLLGRGHSLGLPNSIPWQIIPPAVDLSCLSERKHNGSIDKFKIVTIARLNWIKGIDYLLEVAKYLKNEHFNFEWLVIGSGQEAEYESLLYNLHEKGLQTHVILKGVCSHSETLNLLATTDVYVQTSLNEGFCNAVLEAQAMGVPSVAFKVGGLPENIEDEKTGWLIEPYDVGAMAKTIIYISNFETKEKEEFAKMAVKRVREKFDLIGQKQAFQEFYRF